MGKEKKSLKKKHSRLFAFYGAATLAVLFYEFSAWAEGFFFITSIVRKACNISLVLNR